MEEDSYKQRFTHPGGLPIHEKYISRWDRIIKNKLPNIPTHIPGNLDEKFWDALAIRIRIEELEYALSNHRLGLDTGRDRSPSPPPTGEDMEEEKPEESLEKRREEKLKRERLYVVDRAKELYPEYNIPAELAKPSGKRTRKINIPENSKINYTGLIIGPRGTYQKNLEKETGAKISIRGGGLNKKGKVTNNTDSQEPLHVFITADNQESLDRAAEKIIEIFNANEDDINQMKHSQLKELAIRNGTLRPDRVYEKEPQYQSGVKCEICGDYSHATIDCPLKKKNVYNEKIEEAYNEFMKKVQEIIDN